MTQDRTGDQGLHIVQEASINAQCLHIRSSYVHTRVCISMCHRAMMDAFDEMMVLMVQRQTPVARSTHTCDTEPTSPERQIEKNKEMDCRPAHGCASILLAIYPSQK